jgi:hypothetical protein
VILSHYHERSRHSRLEDLSPQGDSLIYSNIMGVDSQVEKWRTQIRHLAPQEAAIHKHGTDRRRLANDALRRFLRSVFGDPKAPAWPASRHSEELEQPEPEREELEEQIRSERRVAHNAEQPPSREPEPSDGDSIDVFGLIKSLLPRREPPPRQQPTFRSFPRADQW